MERIINLSTINKNGEDYKLTSNKFRMERIINLPQINKNEEDYKLTSNK